MPRRLAHGTAIGAEHACFVHLGIFKSSSLDVHIARRRNEDLFFGRGKLLRNLSCLSLSLYIAVYALSLDQHNEE